ncbi:MAG: HAD-IIB family hydrolase [Bryobacteraceae bacterium]
MFVVFTDLDGTLLDTVTYSWEPARPALDSLSRRGIPLVLCTSKTRAEIEPLRTGLKNRHPFIAENGGAAFVPLDCFPSPVTNAARRDSYYVIEFGSRYDELADSLDAASRVSRVPVLGFHEMTAEEVARRSGLTIEQARLAKQREYDEPFVVLDHAHEQNLLREIERLGKRWTRGGRFLHIMGQNNKAAAVRCLAELYRKSYRSVLTVGLGDAPNDAEFLSVVDTPIIIRSRFAAALKTLVPTGRVSEAAGPAGWNRAILEVIPE